MPPKRGSKKKVGEKKIYILTADDFEEISGGEDLCVAARSKTEAKKYFLKAIAASLNPENITDELDEDEIKSSRIGRVHIC